MPLRLALEFSIYRNPCCSHLVTHASSLNFPIFGIFVFFEGPPSIPFVLEDVEASVVVGYVH
jgi:hypothetical protein